MGAGTRMKPRGTGMPEGFTTRDGPVGMALQDYYNPETKQTYTHSNTGVDQMGEGWLAGKPPPGQEYTQWKDPNAPPKYGGLNPGLKGGGGYWGDLRGKAPPPWGQLQNQLGGLIGGGPPGQYGSSMPPGFPGYDNLPENWQDEGYTWQDPNNPNAKYNIIA